MNVLEDVERDVTVMVTTEVTAVVAPVMEKSFEAVDVVLLVVKKFTVPPSGFAETSILTPFGGMVEVMVTLSGKFGPGAGDSTWPSAAGVVTTTRFCSEFELPPPLF